MAKKYPIEYFLISPAQYDFLQKATAGLNEDTRRLFYHILASNLVQKKHDGWTPISYEFRMEFFPQSDWQVLERRELIQIENYNKKQSKSYEMHVDDDLLDLFLNMGISHYTPETIEAYAATPSINLMNGQSPRKKTITSRKYDAQRNPEPLIIQRVMDTVVYGLCNEQAVSDYLNQLRKEIDDLERANPEDDRIGRLTLRWRNDKHLIDRVVKANREPSDMPGIVRYRYRWEGTTTGRITGGLQSVTRQCKAAVYQGIPNRYNYDLAASQAHIFKLELDAAGIKCPWLERYLEDAQFRKACAALAGMSYDGWKTGFYSLLYGADPDYRQGDFYREIREDVGWHASAARREMLKIVKPLREAMQAYGHYLLANLQQPQDTPFKVVRSPQGLCLINACGKSICIDEIGANYRSPAARQRKQIRTLMAHIIQGKESRFIHELTLLGGGFGFQVVSNEHDGLVTIGQIPLEAINRASGLSGLQGMKLEEKPFYKESDNIINPYAYETFDELVKARQSTL